MANALLALVMSTFAAFFFSGSAATKFTVVNNCPYTVWPATLGGHAQLASTGFELAPKASQVLDAPPNWSGRFWGRTGCSMNAGKLTCQTADCGNGIQCNGLGGAPPSTLIEITLGATDFYDISLVDGFNLPASITPVNNACSASACKSNVLPSCPADQATRGPNGQVVGCLNPCNVFHTPEYCCTGPRSTPETCPPTDRSRIFKNLCPQAYSYAYDDKTSTFTCGGGTDYVVTFCP